MSHLAAAVLALLVAAPLACRRPATPPQQPTAPKVPAPDPVTIPESEPESEPTPGSSS